MGHGTISDQGHADPLLGGGTGNLYYSRIQREIAHPTGTPKFCGNSGAACETFSLDRGNDLTHAPARLSATVFVYRKLVLDNICYIKCDLFQDF